ncbi:MAG: hypothetical protein Q8L55_01290 [Phycisphaerales bacterium]|nr:hypothetical protein [Phycisphaerales bacterium]
MTTDKCGNDSNKASDLSKAHKANANGGAGGDHLIGTGVGAVGVGAATGAIGGAVAGPVGAVAGAVVGAVVGGIAGNATAEAINPTVEGKYWKDNHASRPYADGVIGFDQYAPAYRYGWESFGSKNGSKRTFDTAEADLGRGWNQAKGASTLDWEHARHATRAAWERVEHTNAVDHANK